MNVDHAATPTIGDANIFWEDAMTRLAGLPQVMCTISGPLREFARGDAAMPGANARRIHGLQQVVAS